MGVLVRIHGRLREAAKRGSAFAQFITGEPPRSEHWRTIEKRWLLAHPTCRGCGATTKLNVHHLVSFAKDPTKELCDGTGIAPATGGPGAKPNLVTACLTRAECHPRICHGGSYAGGGYNPNAEADMDECRLHPERRAAIETRARLARIS